MKRVCGAGVRRGARAQVLSQTRLRMRVWERGAGPTLACGTVRERAHGVERGRGASKIEGRARAGAQGACATVVAALLEGRAERRCVVELPGGPLEIEWRESDNRIIMTGPAEAVFAGSL